MELHEVREKIRSAGVIGAGGAGFPTHMKFADGIDTVVVNAAECEPLLYTDFTILQRHLDRVAEGAQAVRAALGAERAVLGVKIHTAEKLGLKDGQPLGGRFSVKTMPNAYPMGDEIVLIYQTLGRVVPPGHLPSSVGVVVINVETAYNVANSLKGIPVTRKWITIGGDVPKPAVYRVPINCDVRAVLEAAGVKIPEGDVVIDGGPAMGNIINPNFSVVTKKTKALVVLPADIPAVAYKLADVHRLMVRTPSACCQCFHCTEICPRHLLGYPLEPHKTLRSVANEISAHPENLLTASLCSGCGVCTLMACCQGVTPSVTMAQVKKALRSNRLGYRADRCGEVNPERGNRLVPVESLKRRIGVAPFDRQAPFGGDLKIRQKKFRLPLSQHVGKPSVPVVQAGAKVAAGSLIAKDAGGISAALHTPVSGTVTAVTGRQIEIAVDEVD